MAHPPDHIAIAWPMVFGPVLQLHAIRDARERRSKDCVSYWLNIAEIDY
jgi:hypothetical protein